MTSVAVRVQPDASTRMMSGVNTYVDRAAVPVPQVTDELIIILSDIWLALELFIHSVLKLKKNHDRQERCISTHNLSNRIFCSKHVQNCQ